MSKKASSLVVRPKAPLPPPCPTHTHPCQWEAGGDYALKLHVSFLPWALLTLAALWYGEITAHCPEIHY